VVESVVAYFSVICPTLSGGVEETHEKDSVRIAGALAEIRTDNYPDINKSEAIRAIRAIPSGLACPVYLK
jgi:hypothetical protein